MVVGMPFRVFYASRNYQPGLIDVRLIVYKPNLQKQGIYTLTEIEPDSGIYSYDYVDSDIPGAYLFVVDSSTLPLKSAKQVYFTNSDNPDLQLIITLLQKPWYARKQYV